MLHLFSVKDMQESGALDCIARLKGYCITMDSTRKSKNPKSEDAFTTAYHTFYDETPSAALGPSTMGFY